MAGDVESVERKAAGQWAVRRIGSGKGEAEVAFGKITDADIEEPAGKR